MSYDYNSWEPVKIDPKELTERETYLLRDSKTFCIYPWIHLHTYPTGETWPCCGSEMAAGPCGSTKEVPLKELWNSDRMRELRLDMLNNRENSWCTRCYEQDEQGFFSMRKSGNKHHGHHIKRVEETNADGSYNEFKMTYIDVRYSNLCNLTCRTCGHIFSSSWYKDQIRFRQISHWNKIKGPSWPVTAPATQKEYDELSESIKDEINGRFHREFLTYIRNDDITPLNFAGKFKMDMFEQVMEHIDGVEQIYFAGGEPLMMDEHYLILDELIKRKRFDVRLQYNTNFTQTKLKDRSVFEYWKQFDNISVGASLDAMDERAEFLRKGTKWNDVEKNRRQMLEICPNVDFYISSTLSIFNCLHIVDFHRDWVEKGFIKPQDFNINILQDPSLYRIDIAPQGLKKQIKEKYQEHLEWLADKDPLNRATNGFKSALNFLNGDNTFEIERFMQRTQIFDDMRNEDYKQVFPELKNIDIDII